MPTSPAAFHVMVKPHGPLCNLHCAYCFYLNKTEFLASDTGFRMPKEVLREFIRQYSQAQKVPEVHFAWQGGEPTLLGVDFFRQAVAWEEEFRRPGARIYNSFQTNGTLLDEEWATFFRENDFLVGLSLDGPRELHNHYRRDKRGEPTFSQVMRGMQLLQKHKVEFNVLSVVNRVNGDAPREVYRFFREQGVKFIQFIPAVARAEDGTVTEWSVRPEQYGRFLTEVFAEWVQRDVGRVFVQIFDVALGAWLGQEPNLCVFARRCGNALAMEHNGDLYACDHFVFPEYRRGNLLETPLAELVGGAAQREFGAAKETALPQYCRECSYLFACHGGCPKDRFLKTPTGEEGLNYLCAGYRAFFTAVDPYLRLMAAEVRAGRPAAGVMAQLAGRKNLPLLGPPAGKAKGRRRAKAG